MPNPGRLRPYMVLSLVLVGVMLSGIMADTTATTTLVTPTQECTNIFGGTGSGGPSTAPTQIPGFAGFPANVFQDAVIAALIGLMVSFDIVGLGYIISRLVPSTNIRNWLPREYWEITKSAILIAVIFSVITLVSGIGVILSGQPSSGTPVSGPVATNINDLTYSAESYLCTVNNEANFGIDNIAPLVIGLGIIENQDNNNGIRITYAGLPVTFTPYLPVFRSGVDFYIFASLLANVNYIYLGQWQSIFIDFILFLLVPVKLIYAGQVILLPYFITIGLTILIPIGLVFRALPLTRGIGGSLIAYGIGFALIWPGILILFNAPVSSYFCSILSGGSNSFCTPLGPDPNTVTQALTGSTSAAAAPDQSNLITGVFNQALSFVGQAWTNGKLEFTLAFDSISDLYPALNLFVKYGIYLILQLFVMLVLDLMLFYALTNNIARMLGGTTRLGLGRRLKLV
ncbi:MAG TPA: hypothetical protein VL945_00515 [Candidatus Saccharimonadales bacterium]|nr:hypothetical protein [Candidatus Saccharimonadales bacterium]